jgi:formamidopyrimidine-DNA glycosylase
VPEILEVESYRRLAEAAVGREIGSVDDIDALLLRRDLDAEALRRALVGARVVRARRRGKLLLLDTSDGDVLGLHFGMTGLLEVDGRLAVERLEYASARLDPAWVRLSVRFLDGGSLVLHDQRRFGAIDLDPQEELLGPDALTISAAALRSALGESRAPLKARLLDQHRVAGLGNLLADEILWRAALAPTRPAGGLERREVLRLHRHLRATLSVLAERGGSHRGVLQEARVAGGRCPRDGAPLRRELVGGGTTYWWAQHQRATSAR